MSINIDSENVHDGTNTITWFNAELSSTIFCDIHRRAIWIEALMNLIRNMFFGNYIFQVITTSPRGQWVIYRSWGFLIHNSSPTDRSLLIHNSSPTDTSLLTHEKKIGHRDCSPWAHCELTVSSPWAVTKMVTASRDLGRDWAVT